MTLWKKINDGEFNEHQATIKMQKVRIYSDLAGSIWDITLNDGDYTTMDATNLEDAKKEAERLAKEEFNRE